MPAVVHQPSQPMLNADSNRSKIFDLRPARPIID